MTGNIKQLDRKAAYLIADLEKDIYTTIPYGNKKIFFNTNKF